MSQQWPQARTTLLAMKRGWFWKWFNFTALLYYSGRNPVNPGILRMEMRQGMKMEWCGAKGDLCYGNGAKEMWPWEQETTV